MSDVTRFGPKPILDLADFIPSDDAQRVLLVRSLVEQGCPPGRAWQILEALERLAATGTDGLPGSRRSEYRQELRKLGEPPWKGVRSSEYMGA
jgi:hypothetical protein